MHETRRMQMPISNVQGIGGIRKAKLLDEQPWMDPKSLGVGHAFHHFIRTLQDGWVQVQDL